MPQPHELDPLPEDIPELTDPEHPERPPAWTIHDDRTAAWALKRIAAAQAQQDEDTQTALAEIASWQQWATDRHQDHQKSIDRLTAHLEAYYHALRDGGKLGRAKTYKLPFGKLKMTSTPPRWRHDEAALLPWAQGKQLIRVKAEADWSTIKAMIANLEEALPGEQGIDFNTGERIPGVFCELPRRPTFRIELNTSTPKEAPHA